MEPISYLFSGLRWQDALDIGFNSYILFRLYVLFRGTNVIRVFLAICVLWAVRQAAVSFGLIVTNWAMQGVITVAALIIIIVFRNDISNVLQTKNLKSFLWGIPRYQYHTPFNTIVETVYKLAEEKIGALIVLPLNHGIDSVVQGGIPLNSNLSRELLVGIFWPGNPLHDGAAIIQGDQITRAGVILPLSKSKDLPSFFGTRHRAAAGLTELTDAMVVVVSEERGKVTLFKGKQTQTTRDKDALTKILQKHAGEDSTRKGFRHQTMELAAAALISLLCITGIWFSFSKGLETLADFEVPVEFMNPDKRMEIISSSASKIKLLISGARPLINAIKPDQINIKLNLSQAVVGINTMAVTKENILLPPGISLKKIDPSELDITLDTLIEKQVAIQPNWTGKLPKGFIMTEAKVIPKTIWITGGELLLRDISTIFTEQLPLDNLTESATITASLSLNPASLKLENKTKISIQYQISKKSDS
ncbi:MAG: diadenylate cyclase [Proteobacteria bacterium]|nr:diadenylate cyclase [Pseudomonadota bacterium]